MFREPRSGSTNVTKFLADVLAREFFFVDGKTIEEVESRRSGLLSSKLLYNTHEFERLSELSNYNNPFIFRCVRKNWVEQFLSAYAVSQIGTNFRNIERYSLTDIDSFHAFTKRQIEVPKRSVLNFINIKRHQEELWTTYSTSYDKHTLYYEDMSVPIDVPILNLYNITIENYTEKLPDYKRDVFTNYDQVADWFSQY